MPSMNHSFYLIFLTFLLSFSNNTSNKVPLATEQVPITTDPAYTWTKLLDSAAWRKNYNFQMFVVRDTLRVFHPDGTWYSTDGTNWAKSSLPNAIQNLAFLDYVQHNDTIFGIGYLKGNIEQYQYRPIIFRTTDCKKWDTLSTQSNLPERFFYHPFVFDHKIWIIGGEDKQTKYADIWNSTDGVNWVQQKDNMPFGKISGSQVVALQGVLYLLNNDVWKSGDGIHWVQVTDAIVKGEQLFGYAALVFDNRIWLLGCNRNGQFSSQVLFSADGREWKTQEAPWLPRGGMAAAVYQQQIFITGGKYGGTPNHPNFRYDNDVWVMGKK